MMEIQKSILILIIFLSHIFVDSVGAFINIKSENSDLTFKEVNTIFSGPSPVIKGSCLDYVLTKEHYRHPETETISSNGWAILSEIKFAQYLLVSFAGKLEWGTSGSCRISSSSIAVFQNGLLEGVISSKKPESSVIGFLQLMDGGFVRINSGEWLQKPVFDIKLDRYELTVQEVSSYTSYCNGRSIIPNVYGLAINQSRDELFKLGFKRKVTAHLSPSYGRDYFKTDGIVEFEWCSATGFGFCKFNYSNNYSNVSLITAGEDRYPAVVDIHVSCK